MWLPTNEEIAQMLRVRDHAPWFLWAYYDVDRNRKMVCWSLSDMPPIYETASIRLAACAVVPSHMLPP
jgi:hypothetical protein